MEQYKYSSADGKVWTRKLHGSEVIMANAAKTLNGWGLFSIGVSLSMLSPTNNIKQNVSDAWTRLRHALPALAALSRGEEDGSGPVFLYQVDDLKEWLDKTIIWHKDEISLAQRHVESKKRAWTASDGHYASELHVSSTTTGLQVLIHGAHWNVDARYLFSVMDLYLSLLKREILKETAPMAALNWGEETVRLPPSAAVASGLFGQPFPPPPPGNPIIFMRPCKLVDNPPPESIPDYTHRITLTTEESSQFRQACKSRGRTATQILGSLWVLAEIKTTMWLAKTQPDKYGEATDLYKTADLTVCALTLNARNKLLTEYSSLSSVNATPGMSVDSVPVMFDMNVVRKALQVSSEGMSFRNSDPTVFWNEVVPAFIAAWGSVPTDAASFVSREEFFNAHPEVLTFDKPAIVCSSIGDIDMLGLIGKTAFVPAFTVDELDSAIRFSGPLNGVMVWQWNGRMELRFASGPKTVEKNVLEHQAQIYMDMLRLVSL